MGLQAFLRQLPSKCGIRCSHRPGTRPSQFCLPGGGPGVALGSAVSRKSRSPSGHPASNQAEAERGPPSLPARLQTPAFPPGCPARPSPPKEENPGARVTRPIVPVRSCGEARRAAQDRVGVRGRSQPWAARLGLSGTGTGRGQGPERAARAAPGRGT